MAETAQPDWRHDMWRTRLVSGAVRRIENAPTLEQQQLQAQLETIVVLHSIRRVLLWVLIIVPAILVALWLVLSAASAL